MVRLLEVRGSSSNPIQTVDRRKFYHGFPVIRARYSVLSDWLRTMRVYLQEVGEWHRVNMKFTTAVADVGDRWRYGADTNGYLWNDPTSDRLPPPRPVPNVIRNSAGLYTDATGHDSNLSQGFCGKYSGRRPPNL